MDSGCDGSDRGAIGEELPGDIPVVIVQNKIDLCDAAAGRASDDTINLSAKTGAGIDALRSAIKALAGYQGPGEGAFSARRRHVDALERARRHFRDGRRALAEARAGELLAEEVRLSQQALGEITGAVSSDELLGEIFASFCIGK